MKITLVKKVMADGTPCRKCREVEALMEKHEHNTRIDEVVVADEANPLSAGMLLAAKYQVERAPFFIVEWDNGRVDIYTVYLKFAKEVLNLPDSELKKMFTAPASD